MSNQGEALKKSIRDIPDFPKPGIVFRYITPILADMFTFWHVFDLMCSACYYWRPDSVAAIEARGFIPGAAIALRLECGFVPIRKRGKLPWDTVSQFYDLEYGQDELQVHADGAVAGQKVLIVDDVLATGGTAAAAVELIRKLGAEVLGVQVLIELSALGGRKRLEGIEVLSEVVY